MSNVTETARPAVLGTVILTLGWIAAGLLTAVLLLLLVQPFSMPECVSYDKAGQNVARIGAVVIAVALIAVWIGAVRLLRTRWGASGWTRAGLAVALPVAVLFTFTTGASIMDAAVDRVADTSDSASCW